MQPIVDLAGIKVGEILPNSLSGLIIALQSLAIIELGKGIERHNRGIDGMTLNLFNSLPGITMTVDQIIEHFKAQNPEPQAS